MRRRQLRGSLLNLMQHRSLTTLFTVLALAACVSIDDRKLTEHDGDTGEAGESQGGTGGSAGSAGSATGGTETGGSAGEGGSSGKGGTSMTGGSAGKGGTAGQGGSGAIGPTEDCDGDPLAIDEEVVRACLLQVGCNPFVPSTSLSFCITNQRLNTFPQDDCGTGADGLRGLPRLPRAGLLQLGRLHERGARVLRNGDSRRRVRPLPYAIDCAQFGGECATYTDDGGAERVWCRIPELDGCTDPAGMEQCSASGVSYTCIDGTAFGNDCPLIGSECRDGACYYVLPACTTPGATCGTAARLDLCYDSLDVARYTCAGGLGCEESATTRRLRRARVRAERALRGVVLGHRAHLLLRRRPRHARLHRLWLPEMPRVDAIGRRRPPRLLRVPGYGDRSHLRSRGHGQYLRRVREDRMLPGLDRLHRQSRLRRLHRLRERLRGCLGVHRRLRRHVSTRCRELRRVLRMPRRRLRLLTNGVHSPPRSSSRASSSSSRSKPPERMGKRYHVFGSRLSSSTWKLGA